MGYILFSSKENFSIEVVRPRWNGIIEYSYDNKKWNIWHGEKIINNTIYMRGINNTVISGSEFCMSWNIIGIEVRCQGNIENLLDYQSVINNIHPKMDRECFAWMFWDCTALIEAPQLLTVELAFACYCRMFCNTSITKISMIVPSDVQLNHYTYTHMFCNCSLLTETPMFPNLTIAKEAIINQYMLENCPIQQININNKLYDINVLKLL